MVARVRTLLPSLGRALPRALAVALVVGPVLLFLFAVQRKTQRKLMLPGPTSSGHHQIEDRCESCHTPFGGVQESACLRCHQGALDRQNDSHAASKFQDPGRAAQLAHVDARSCLSCHREHRPEARQRGSVSVATEFCMACHQEVRDRPNHRELADRSCADVGCHNYHDNRHLHRDLLVKARQQPDHAPRPLPMLTRTSPPARPLAPRDADLPGTTGAPDVEAGVFDRAVAGWAASAHAVAAVNCRGCHGQAGSPQAPDGWSVGAETCARCHAAERAGFVAGKHGMRLPEGLSAMRPDLARAPMKPEAHGRQMDCGSCHQVHRFDTGFAAVDACEGCHDDGHTRAYRDSPHFALWKLERGGRAAPGTGVSCATCHLPRRQERGPEGRLLVRAVHNQNDNLRPPDRMAREVCGHCHGLGFSLAALADRQLVDGNFNGTPGPVRTAMDLIQADKTDRKGAQ